MTSEILEKSSVFFDSFARKPGQPFTTHYCPGCGHGTLHKLLAEALQEMGLQDRTVLIAPVGCAVFLYYYFECAAISAPHGRAPSVGTAIGRCHSDAITISYQGDGDLAAIGTNNALHAANRGENMLVLFVNNNVYGMTGGQLAPTSLIGQKTTTTPFGRSELNDGPPLRMAEIIATLDAPVFVARTALNTPQHVREARKTLRKGLEIQRDRLGYAFIEFLAQCPTNWHMSAPESCAWIQDVVIPQYPLGVFKDVMAERRPQIRELRECSFDEILNVVGGGREPHVPPSRGAQPLAHPIHFKSAGFGGQGVLSLGTFVAQAAMRAGRHVTWLPSYGPEMRGGVANCGVVIDDQPVGSPVVNHPNLLVAMNSPSIVKFGPLVPEGGTIIVNRSMVEELPEGLAGVVHQVRATELAEKLGNGKAANVVALGFMAATTGMFTLDELDAVLEEKFGRGELLALNRKAVRAGWDEAEG